MRAPYNQTYQRLSLRSSHGYTRFRRATVSPQGLNLDNVRSQVQKAQEEIAALLYDAFAYLYCVGLTLNRSTDARETRINTSEIKEQCKELRKENLGIKEQCAKLRGENEGISKRCAGLQTQLRVLYNQKITDRLSHLKRLLNASGISSHQREKQFEESLRRTFEFNKKRVPRYRDSLKILEKDPAFKTWKSSESSAVLVLSGHSSGTLPSQRFCWLSAAAMDFIKRMREYDCPVACFYGQKGTTLPDWQARATDKEALHDLIEQIAGWDPCCLQAIDFEQHIRSGDRDGDNILQKVKFLQALLDSYSKAEPVYLVFDNVKMSNEPPTRLRPVLVKRMVELVRDAQLVVKILFVGLDADFDEVELDILRETVTGLGREQLLSRLRWDSATLRRLP